jgi:hypothetical protein
MEEDKCVFFNLYSVTGILLDVVVVVLERCTHSFLERFSFFGSADDATWPSRASCLHIGKHNTPPPVQRSR